MMHCRRKDNHTNASLKCKRTNKLNPRLHFGLVFLAALLLTGLNALKPMTIDDTAYFYFAEQIAAHPTDPYGGTIFWYDQPQPAQEILAPPVFLYYLALSVKLFGMNPVLWKWSLFPLCWLFVWSVFQLLRRFAQGLEWPMTFFVVFSPAILPSVNLMLDIPALAFSWAAVHFFIRAIERGSWHPTLLAGALAGLSMQTKYTGFLTPAIFGLYALTHRGILRALLASMVAVALFASWEVFTALQYGESHFLFHLQQRSTGLLEKLEVLPLIFSLIGSIGVGLLFLGLLALRLRRRWILLSLVSVFLLYLVMGLVGVTITFETTMNAVVFPPMPTLSNSVTLSLLAFGMVGIVIWAFTGVSLWHLCRWNRKHQSARKVNWFLGCWLLLEIGGFCALTPFPAIRRILGMFFVLCLILGRFASRMMRIEKNTTLLYGMVIIQVFLGSLYWSVDYQGAWAQQKLAHRASDWIASNSEAEKESTVWFTGHWGWQFYAERQGMRPLIPHVSRVHVGDWIVMPDSNVHQQEVELPIEKVNLIHEMTFSDRLPFRTMANFYDGYTGFIHQRGPRLKVSIYRAEQEFLAGQ